MLNANEALLLSKEAAAEKEASAVAKRLKEIENEIKEICSVGGTSLAVCMKKKFQSLFINEFEACGYKVLPSDPDIEDEHIIISWGE